MKKVVLLCLVLVLIIGCAAAPKYVCPDGSTVDDKAKCTVAAAKPAADTTSTATKPAAVEEKTGTTPAKTEPAPATPTMPAKTMDNDLKTILDRISKVTSYEFTYQYGTQDVTRYTVVGDKIKVTLMFGNPDYYNYGYYDRVLLDTREKTAIAYCVERSACEEENKKVAKKMSYEEFAMPIDPIQLIKSITYAEVIGEITCDGDRPCTRIKFEEDGEEVEMHVDNYYGFPYYWKKGDVEKTLSGVVYMPRNPEAALPSVIETTLE